MKDINEPGVSPEVVKEIEDLVPYLNGLNEALRRLEALILKDGQTGFDPTVIANHYSGPLEDYPGTWAMFTLKSYKNALQKDIAFAESMTATLKERKHV